MTVEAEPPLYFQETRKYNGLMFVADVWRGLFDSPRFEDSLAGVAALLAKEIHAAAVIVRHLELPERSLATRAFERTDSELVVAPVKTSCSSRQVELLLQWTRSDDILLGSPATDERIRLLAGTNEPLDAIVAPLADEESSLHGGLVLLGPQGAFSPDHQRDVRKLIAPFRAALASALRFHELARLREVVEADNRALRSKLDRQDAISTIVGADSGFRDVMTRVEQVAPTDTPVLLLGETGTGKEVAARAIHSRSGRANGPMLRVNCGAIPAGLVDSELFGHERGSFTGAVAKRAGWFERADGGTLFLDEIGELSPAAQVRLLRVLQEGVLERVGGQHLVPVDVRVIAATHRDLGEMVGSTSFRQDLWYRISVFPIWLPPLRDRREDIPLLAAHFAWAAGRRLGGQPLVPSDTDLGTLVAYDWPGNVRELAAVIERAAILGNGKHLDVASALGAAQGKGGTRPSFKPPPSSNDTPASESNASETLSLNEVIRRHIEAVLSKTRGRIEGKGGAAAQLGVNPHTLRSRMRKLGIRWNDYR